MENEKHSSFIGIINSEKWKQLKGYFNIYLIGYENFDYSKPENEIIEHTQNLFSNIDKQIRNALDYLLTNNITSTEKNKIFAYSKELNILKFVCKQKLISLNAKPLNYELLYFDYMDLVDKPKKEVSKYAYEIEKEFNEFIKIEAPETKEPKTKSNFIIEKNPFPDVFTGTDNKNYLIFKSFTEKYIIDRYNDFSFIIQKMKNEKRITRITHFELMKWLKENNFISEKTFEDFIKKGSFTTKALLKPERQNSYDLIIIDIDKRNFE